LKPFENIKGLSEIRQENRQWSDHQSGQWSVNWNKTELKMCKTASSATKLKCLR